MFLCFFVFTSSSLRRELSSKATLKWTVRSRVQITCNTPGVYHVQHAVCHAARRDSSATKFNNNSLDHWTGLTNSMAFYMKIYQRVVASETKADIYSCRCHVSVSDAAPVFSFFFFLFFFFAFPSYISGVHHFWVRFLRM